MKDTFERLFQSPLIAVHPADAAHVWAGSKANANRTRKSWLKRLTRRIKMSLARPRSAANELRKSRKPPTKYIIHHILAVRRRRNEPPQIDWGTRIMHQGIAHSESAIPAVIRA
ncbi:hypothetical protein [Ciceribacter azotifigens]|uniref:hypothetical protein n=1 Tax=Ciceribacter azotifigens TaxID=2069303 RepID=UPI003A88E860